MKNPQGRHGAEDGETIAQRKALVAGGILPPVMDNPLLMPLAAMLLLAAELVTLAVVPVQFAKSQVA